MGRIVRARFGCAMKYDPGPTLASPAPPSSEGATVSEEEHEMSDDLFSDGDTDVEVKGNAVINAFSFTEWARSEGFRLASGVSRIQ